MATDRMAEEQSLRVLVVEDEKESRRALHEYLALCGHEVESACDGQTAIDIGGRFRPQVLVSDWRLGSGPDGVTVARALVDAGHRLRVVFLTAFERADLEHASQGLPVTAIFRKPVRLSILLSAVES